MQCTPNPSLSVTIPIRRLQRRPLVDDAAGKTPENGCADDRPPDDTSAQDASGVDALGVDARGVAASSLQASIRASMPIR